MTRRRKLDEDRADLNIQITMRPDGAVIWDPQFNKRLIDYIDKLYTTVDREDYETEWSDEHKLAYLLADHIEQVLAQWQPPVDQREVDVSVASVPHISESPVNDRHDLDRMTPARARRPN